MQRDEPARLSWTLWGFALSSVVLFLGFFDNSWRVAEPTRFADHQIDSQAHIVGRLVQSRQSGLFSKGGLTGLGTPELRPSRPTIEDPTEFQYRAYLDDLAFESYTPYESQIGAQGLLFSALNRILPWDPPDKLRFFQAWTALLSALVLAWIVAWFHQELGLFTALVVLASMVGSQWLTVFGRNLWWSTWAFFLPIAAVLFYLRKERTPSKRQLIVLASIVFATVFVKCLFNGYEYITTTLIMTVVPAVYYGRLDQDRRATIRWMVAAATGAVLAVGLSSILLCLQVAAVEGSFMDGVDQIVFSLKKRTHADPNELPPIYAESLEASTGLVVSRYLNGVFIDLGNYFSASGGQPATWLKVRYVYLIAGFLFLSVWLASRGGTGDGQRRHLALIQATWISILAPLSWLVLFKAHSYIHTHMNFIVWQMPFTLFGFAVSAKALETAISRRGRPANRPETESRAE